MAMKKPSRSASSRALPAKTAPVRIRRPAAAAQKRPAAKAAVKTMKVMKIMKAKSQRLPPNSPRALKLITEARTLKAFTTAVSRVADVNRLSELHPDWLRRLVINDCWNGWRYQHNRLNKDKLEVLLDAGLDVDTPGLLFTAVWGSSSCLSLLLKRGADPLGDRARNPGHLGNLEQCPFVAAAEEREKLAQLRELKKALERHPKYAHRAAEEWRDAIERMHKNLLEMSGRRHYVKEKKWLRDEILQHVDKGYAVRP